MRLCSLSSPPATYEESMDNAESTPNVGGTVVLHSRRVRRCLVNGL